MTSPDSMPRRSLLRAAGLTAVGMTGCRPGEPEPPAEAMPEPPLPPESPPQETPGREFAPVRVEEDRIIRTVVGLRPFRPSGFVVRAETQGRKTVIHHYGHGGGGVSLSWGTAHVAVELAEAHPATSHAVIGCGAVGLATARLLQRRGSQVTIYAKDLPPQTTSNVAGAQWQPFTVSDRAHRTPAYEALQERAARLSHRYFQDLTGHHYGVRWIENYSCTEAPEESYRADPIADLYPDGAAYTPGGHPFPTPHARRFSTLFIETPVYLAAVLRDFLQFGGRIVVREFASQEEWQALEEPVVVNCTGLGARALCGDEELTPIKGQLIVLLPQPEVDYITLAGALYMFPRTDGILLGGTMEHGEWSLEVNEEARARVLEGHRAFFAGMKAG